MTESSNRPTLQGVTLVAVTSVALSATVEALRKSTEQADFDKVLLLSDKPPSPADVAVTWRPIEPIRSREDYSHFILSQLAKHIETSHALCIQWDGYVLDGRSWDSEFLKYDYVGAVWPHFSDGHTVGNGGFSLRSRRLLQACTTLPYDRLTPEDVLISRLCRPQLEKKGISFAPERVARRFAYERTAPRGDEFGFHGAFNLVRHLDRKGAVALFQSLEPELLARNERLEIFRWALARGRVKLAAQMLRGLQ